MAPRGLEPPGRDTHMEFLSVESGGNYGSNHSMCRLSFQKARFLEQPRRGRGTDESQGRRSGVPAIPPIRRFRGPSLAALKNVPSGAKDATCYGQIHNYPPRRRKGNKCAYRVPGDQIPSVPCVKPLQSSSGRSLVDHPKCRDEEGASRLRLLSSTS